MTAPATLRGITVEQYAGITAALAEDLPIEAVLAHEALAPRAWKPVDLAWKARLAADGVEGPVFKTYSIRLAEAEDWLAREVAPLQEDLAAWLGFLAAWGKHEAPFDLLAGAGLRLSDVSRLRRRWSRRFSEDASLEKRAAELLRKGPGPVPRISVGRLEHRPYPWSRAGAAARPAAAPEPATPPDKASADNPPGPEAAAPRVLLVPSFMKVREQASISAPAPSRPEPPVAPSAAVPFGGTAEVDLAALRAPLPFAGTAEVDPAAPRAPLPFGGTAEVDLAALGVPLPFAGRAADEEAVSRAKQADASARNPPAAAPVAEIGKTGDVPADLIQRLARGRLPFTGAQPTTAAPSPPPRGMPVETVELTPGLVQKLAAAPLPFKEQPSSGPPPAPVAPSPPTPAPPPPAPQEPRFGETTELTPDFLRRVAAGRPLPFQAGETRPSATPAKPAADPPAKPASEPAPRPSVQPAASARPAPRLTMEQHASYRAELTVFRDQAGVVLARYGLTDAGVRAAEEEAWADLLRSRPEMKARWEELHRSYVGYWTARSRAAR